MSALRALVADDEPLVRSDIRDLCRDAGNVKVVAEARNGREALAMIERYRPEIVFLDVQMPEVDGFEVLAALDPEQRPAIVFVTAYDQYALRAFDEHAVDYLLKPFDRERFRLALDRARQRLRSGEGEALDRVLAALARRVAGTPAYLERVAIRERGRIQYVAVSDIDWIQAADNYARIHTGGRRHVVRTTMKQLEGSLDPSRFGRIHRSAIVNLTRVAELQPLVNGEYEVLLTTGQRLTLSRGYREGFLRRMEAGG